MNPSEKPMPPELEKQMAGNGGSQLTRAETHMQKTLKDPWLNRETYVIKLLETPYRQIHDLKILKDPIIGKPQKCFYFHFNNCAGSLERILGKKSLQASSKCRGKRNLKISAHFSPNEICTWRNYFIASGVSNCWGL